MNEDRCICCGEIIPEGRMVCPNCSEKAYQKDCEGANHVRIAKVAKPAAGLEENEEKGSVYAQSN
jgi:RNA polymerase subunit RPABC4/transcription elongation factor Spt4